MKNILNFVNQFKFLIIAIVFTVTIGVLYKTFYNYSWRFVFLIIFFLFYDIIFDLDKKRNSFYTNKSKKVRILLKILSILIIALGILFI